ncbi:glycerol kinase [Paenibacillus turicensis]|uniref:ATP:glycerol 3-phosphotransferase n=1 Tax=Paenibacillus turicensis TaxID=160487 RepID=A0ABS4FVB5_9BACL|nr:glycerol kinase GlpK [Paenibacillus turicensis]MBP1906528.1 glycerol kinase [Paenibacillus turicensis]
MTGKQKYILSIDQSTSGTKTLLVNQQGEVIARSAMEHKQLYPQPGWVEHDPLEIYENVKQCMQNVMKKVGATSDELAAVTITNQRETAVMWDKATGLPIHNAIVWQCQRTAEICRQLKEKGVEAQVKAKTGLLIDPYFSATKFSWMLEHVEGAPQLVNENRLLAGTMDSWLVWKLTGGTSHVTDYSNASRTSLFNIHTLQWDEELGNLFEVPLSILPKVHSSDSIVGYMNDESIFSTVSNNGSSLPVPIPISGLIGDSQGALFGHLCFEPGTAKATYGTGTSLLMNVGTQPVDGGEGLVTTIAWGADGKVTYALEAVIRSSGDSIKWTRDNLGLFSTFEEMQQLVDSLPSNEGVYLVPAFVGLGVPYWDPCARAAIVGMTRGSTKAHIIRAALESTTYQIRDAVDFMQQQSGVSFTDLRTDGGASANRWLMQFQADILGQSVIRSTCPELSALGSVYLGGVAVGFWSDYDHLPHDQNLYELFQPTMSEQLRESNYAGWKSAVQSVVTQ